ncbi:MAG: TRAP transporter fused permease subunit [Alphaproteobacteria bacterium]|nr:TRAP transporter fused permease subunit [Alphaproteobacteria bacterium]
MTAARPLSDKLLEGFAYSVALILIAYSIVTVWTSLTGAMEHYTIHVTLVFLLAIADLARRYGGGTAQLGVTTGEEEIRAPSRIMFSFTLLLAVGMLAAGIYFVMQAKILEFSQPFISQRDFVFGAVLVFVILAVTWLTWGWPLAVICILGAVYFAFGNMLPEALATGRTYDANLIMSYLAGMGGPRGVLTYAPLSADVIFLLLVYGGALHGTRVIDMFGEVGNAIGNMFRGGVAYSAMVASLLIGMVTGQSVSNIALSGSMTIPTMVRTGFTRNQAGAIEVLASTGSQLLPPIMGLGAFLMSEILGISYVEIAIAAIIPAALYLFAVFAGIVCVISASKTIPYKRQPVDWRLIAWIAPSFVASFTVLVYLLAYRYSAPMAAFWGLVIVGMLSVLRPKEYRATFSGVASGLLEGALTGARLAVILSAIGILVQMLVTTGAGLSMGRLMIELSAGNLAIGLILGMCVSLVIGMGLPTPAAYALIAIVVVPSLIDLGIEPLVANFYGFYFAIFSTLTPPVAVGILTAIRISNGTFMGTAWECFKLGAVCFLVPFLFVAYPNILGFPNLVAETWAMVGAFAIATLMLSASIYGAIPGRKLSIGERYAVFAAGPALFSATLFLEGAIWHALTPMAFAGWMVWAYVDRTRNAQKYADASVEQ